MTHLEPLVALELRGLGLEALEQAGDDDRSRQSIEFN